MVSEEERVYDSRSKASQVLLSRALRSIPLGCNSNYRTWKPHHLYFSRARGSHIWDADGHGYTDFMLAFGTLVVGHCHPLLAEGMREVLEEIGTMYAMPYDRSVDLAEELAKRFGMAMWRLTNSGTEATMHALRLARAYTGREKVVKMEGAYHGAHDYLLVSTKPKAEAAGDPRKPNPVPASEGMPEATWRNTLVVPFNDADALERIMRENEREVAAVILEPVAMNMGVVPPAEGYLREVRRLTHEHDVLLIFDEVKTACKVGYSSAAQLYGIKPDIMTLAKAIGGGYPLGAFGARPEFMEPLGQRRAAHLGTFNANPLVVNASLITLRRILTEAAYTRMFKLESSLAKGTEEVLQDAGLEGHVAHQGVNGTVYFTPGPIRNYRDFLRHDPARFDRYFVAMMNRGVIPEGVQYDEQWTVSVQHSPEDIERHLSAFQEVAPLLTKGG